MKRSDSEIKKMVEQELTWDMQVNSAEVGVTVKNGVVALVGNTSSWAERQAAQRAAHRVAGVLDVANDLTVQVPGDTARTDIDIAQAIRHALDWDVFVPKGKITSTVNDGGVVLEGHVDNWSQRTAAEKAIRNLAGVVNVVNKIEVKPQVFSGDIRHAIEAALDRRAERQVSGIGIEVTEGRVKLTGVVNSWVEKQAILGASRATPGVHSVDDETSIDWRAS